MECVCFNFLNSGEGLFTKSLRNGVFFAEGPNLRGEKNPLSVGGRGNSDLFEIKEI